MSLAPWHVKFKGKRVPFTNLRCLSFHSLRNHRNFLWQFFTSGSVCKIECKMFIFNSHKHIYRRNEFTARISPATGMPTCGLQVKQLEVWENVPTFQRQTKIVKHPHSLVAEYFNVTDVYRSALIVEVIRNRQMKTQFYFNSNHFRFRNCRESK